MNALERAALNYLKAMEGDSMAELEKAEGKLKEIAVLWAQGHHIKQVEDREKEWIVVIEKDECFVQALHEEGFITQVVKNATGFKDIEDARYVLSYFLHGILIRRSDARKYSWAK